MCSQICEMWFCRCIHFFFVIECLFWFSCATRKVIIVNKIITFSTHLFINKMWKDVSRYIMQYWVYFSADMKKLSISIITKKKIVRNEREIFILLWFDAMFSISGNCGKLIIIKCLFNLQKLKNYFIKMKLWKLETMRSIRPQNSNVRTTLSLMEKVKNQSGSSGVTTKTLINLFVCSISSRVNQRN